MSSKNKIITNAIAGTVLALTTLFSGAAQAYIPSDVGYESQSYYSFQVPGLNSDTAAIPMPRRLPFFSNNTPFPTFRVSTEVAAVAPLGFQILCVQTPEACTSSPADRTSYSPRTMQMISAINRQVNNTIIAKNDVGMDRWVINPQQGDCEDYVLTKRAQLVSSGLPMSALRIATALTSSGVGHAVLVLRTDRGDLILDNLTNAIKPWGKTDLNMLTISGANPEKWFNIV